MRAVHCVKTNAIRYLLVHKTQPTANNKPARTCSIVSTAHFTVNPLGNFPFYATGFMFIATVHRNFQDINTKTCPGGIYDIE